MTKTVFFVLYLVGFVGLMVMVAISKDDLATMILLATIAIVSKSDYNTEKIHEDLL